MIVCLVTGMVYVGSATGRKGFMRRKECHWSLLRTGKHDNQHLQAAWNLYGEAAFVFCVIQRLPPDGALCIDWENYWIRRLHATDRDHGYNMCPAAGNCLGLKHSDKTRAKLSAIRSTPEARAENSARVKLYFTDPKNRARHQAVCRTPESRAARSAWRKAFLADPDNLARVLATLHSPEAKARWSATMTALHADPVFKAKQRAGMVAWYADPANRGKIEARCKKISEAKLAYYARKREEEARQPGGEQKSLFDDADCA
jgi:group I intron endonuclease